MVKGSGTITTLAIFDGYNGSKPTPYSSLIADANGNLYGTALRGGAAGYDAGMGTVFQVTGSGFVVTGSGFVTEVPAPAGLGLFGMGLAALGMARRRRAVR